MIFSVQHICILHAYICIIYTIVTTHHLILNYITPRKMERIQTFVDSTIWDYAQILWEVSPVDPMLLTQTIMIGLATVSVYWCCRATVEKPLNAKDPDKDSPLYHPSDLYTSLGSDRIQEKEAVLAPFIAGSVLVGIYYAFKLNPEIVKRAFRMVFNCTAVTSVMATASMALTAVSRGLPGRPVLPHWQLALFRDITCKQPGVRSEAEQLEEINVDVDHQLVNVNFSLADILGTVAAAGLVYLNVNAPSWLFGNIMAMCMVINGGRLLKFSTYKIALIALTGLFIYDIYFVFYTDVMMTVAVNIDAPIKLELPRPPATLANSSFKATSLLGLGDIAVPSMFISFLLRYDVWNYYDLNQELPFHLARRIPTPFFNAGMISYVLGLAGAIVAMLLTGLGQPALLYLCPSVMGVSLAMCLWRGELKRMWSFVDGEKIDDGEDKTKEKAETAKSRPNSINSTRRSRSSANKDPEIPTLAPKRSLRRTGSTNGSDSDVEGAVRTRHRRQTAKYD